MTDQAQLLRDALESYEHAIANGHREHDALSAFANISVPDLARAALSAPAQPASGEAVAYRETITGRLCEPDDEHRRKFPMCYRPLSYADTTPPASQEQAPCINCGGMGYVDGVGEACKPCGGSGQEQADMQAVAEMLLRNDREAALQWARGVHAICDEDGAYRVHVQASQEQSNNLCFELSTHLGCAPSNADVIAAVSSLIDARQTASQEQAQPSGEVVAYLLCGGRLYKDQVVMGRGVAEDRARTRDDGTKIEPLVKQSDRYTAPQPAQPAQPAARVAMTDGAKRALISNFFSEGWAQDAAMNLLHDFERGITSNGATDAGVAE